MNSDITILERIRPLFDDMEQLLAQTTFEERSHALIEAARNDDMGAVEILLPQSDATLNNSDALEWSVYNNNINIARLLLPHSSPKDSESGSLQLAIAFEQPDFFDLLYPVSDPQAALEDMLNKRYSEPEILMLRQRIKIDEERQTLSSAVEKQERVSSSRKM